ncbi:MAG: FAD-dependent oxidoreductase [Pseudomonadota bacterium]
MQSEPRIAVVGAGIAGLACARTLHDQGYAVRLFDKSRGLGGRLATRRVGDLAFDHGAQYVTARDPRFVRQVEDWAAQRVVAAWQPRGRASAEPWWVGAPRMTALARHVAAGLDVTGEVAVKAVAHGHDRWQVRADDQAYGPFDAVVVAVPAPQAVPLLDASAALAAAAGRAVMQPCWAALVALPTTLDLPDVLRPEDGPLAWLARDASKPGRAPGERWVLHASPSWSASNLERSPADVLPELLQGLGTVANETLAEPTYAAAHRWRYALAAQPVGEDCLFDADLGLAACGDWCLGGRVEAAWLSGQAVAGRIVNWAAERAG